MARKIKIAPSIKSGAHHWLMERISAVALIFLTIWLVVSLLQIIASEKYLSVFFAYPVNAFMGILFVGVGLYHGSLGMKVIIEDYTQSKIRKHFYIMFFHFLSIVTAVAAIVAIIRLHLIG